MIGARQTLALEGVQRGTGDRALTYVEGRVERKRATEMARGAPRPSQSLCDHPRVVVERGVLGAETQRPVRGAHGLDGAIILREGPGEHVVGVDVVAPGRLDASQPQGLGGLPVVVRGKE